jgi:hypothetical protein
VTCGARAVWVFPPPPRMAPRLARGLDRLARLPHPSTRRSARCGHHQTTPTYSPEPATASKSPGGGGTGRTGTVIACMAILAGHPAADAVAWTRRHYRPRAVETPSQRRWIGWFATHAHTP